MILEIDNDEWEHLNKVLGGPYENVTRVLGSGLTGEGRLRLLAKVQALKPPVFTIPQHKVMDNDHSP